MTKDIRKAIVNVRANGFSVDHVTLGRRTVAIRHRAGVFHLIFQDGATQQSLADLTEKRAEKTAIRFLSGKRSSATAPVLRINQADRFCAVVKTTATRVRVEYEMPNAGLMGSWQYYVDVCDKRYYSTY
jgi:hypothetical protein